MARRKQSKKSAQLGELEAAVMGIIWEREAATVQDVVDALKTTRKLAYTTVMTVMSRMAEKGLLARRKDGRAYIYTPSESQEKLAGSLLRSLVERLYAGATGSAVAHLLEADDNVDEAELERLEQLIRAKRKGGK